MVWSSTKFNPINVLFLVTFFIVQSLQQMTYEVKDKLLAERVLKMEFTSPGANDASVVYRGE